MKYFIIAGELSGDMHAATLVRALLARDPSAQIYAWAGEATRTAGANVLRDYKEYSVMGFGEVLGKLRKIALALRACRQSIRQHKPDVLILVDFPGFNLRMARFANRIGIRVVYYISPKLWAWKKNRIRIIRQHVHQMLCVLPFEIPFYKGLGYHATYVGNPLVAQIRQHDFRPILELDGVEKRTIACLPGSRVQEVMMAADVFAALSRAMPLDHFVVAAVRNIPASHYAVLEGLPNVSLIYERAYDVLKQCDAAIVTSGTATLEAALIGTPQVVCYKTSRVSYAIGKALVNVKYISLVNLLLGRPAVQELIQDNFHVDKLVPELDRLTKELPYRNAIIRSYEEISQLLGEKNAADAAAEYILKESVMRP